MKFPVLLRSWHHARPLTLVAGRSKVLLPDMGGMTGCLRQRGLPQSIVADFSTGFGIFFNAEEGNGFFWAPPAFRP